MPWHATGEVEEEEEEQCYLLLRPWSLCGLVCVRV